MCIVVDVNESNFTYEEGTNGWSHALALLSHMRLLHLHGFRLHGKERVASWPRRCCSCERKDWAHLFPCLQSLGCLTHSLLACACFGSTNTELLCGGLPQAHAPPSTYSLACLPAWLASDSSSSPLLATIPCNRSDDGKTKIECYRSGGGAGKMFQEVESLDECRYVSVLFFILAFAMLCIEWRRRLVGKAG